VRGLAMIGLVLAACSVPGKFLVTGDAGGDDAPPVDGTMVPSGEYVWIRSMSSITTYGVAAGAAGLTIVGGLTVPGDLGGGTLTPVGSYDMVVGGLAEADASHIYSKRIGDTASEFGFLDVTDSSGAPLVYGLTSGTPYDLGLGSTASGGGTDGFIGKYGPNAPSWVQRAYGTLDDKFLISARGAGSTVYAGGYFEGTTLFNGGQMTSAGGRDALLARMNTFTGAVDLTKQYGGTGRDEVSGVFATTGGLILTGLFDDTINFGGTSSPLTSGGLLDIYIAKLDTNGAGVWAVRYGGAGDDRDVRVAVDGSGDIYIAGTFQQTLSFGTIMLTANGAADAFVAKLRGTDGSPIWATSFGGTGDDAIRGIGVDAQGRVAVSGWVTGAIDGGTTLGGADAVITSYAAADGMMRWRKVYSTAGDDRAWPMTYGTSGDLFVGVHLGGTYDFGHAVIGPASPASVIVRISP